LKYQTGLACVRRPVFLGRTTKEKFKKYTAYLLGISKLSLKRIEINKNMNVNLNLIHKTSMVHVCHTLKENKVR